MPPTLVNRLNPLRPGGKPDQDECRPWEQVCGGESQQWELNPQPPHYECGALPIEAMLARFRRGKYGAKFR